MTPSPSSRGYFVTGTNTGVGKTFALELLLREAHAHQRRVLPYKPLCCGDPGDLQALAAATQHRLSPEEICAQYYASPVTPLVAAELEHQPLDPARLHAQGERLLEETDHLLIEGVGGWRSPLAPDYHQCDLARHFSLPVLLVVSNELGALNHTLLTLEALAADHLPCAGLLLNHLALERDLATITNRSTLQQLTDVPILGEILPNAQSIDWSEGHSLDTLFPPSLLASPTP